MSKDESPPLVYVRSALRVTMSDLRTSRASLLFRFCLQRHILSRFDDMQWRDLLESEREYLGTASMRACRLDELFLDDMGALQTFIEKFHPLFNAALLGVVTWAMLFWKRLIVSMSLAYLLGVTGLGKRAYRAAKKVKSTNRQLVASCVGVNVLYAMLVLPGVALLDDSCLYVEVAELICGGLLTCFALKRLTEKLRRTADPRHLDAQRLTVECLSIQLAPCSAVAAFTAYLLGKQSLILELSTKSFQHFVQDQWSWERVAWMVPCLVLALSLCLKWRTRVEDDPHVEYILPRASTNLLVFAKRWMSWSTRYGPVATGVFQWLLLGLAFSRGRRSPFIIQTVATMSCVSVGYTARLWALQRAPPGPGLTPEQVQFLKDKQPPVSMRIRLSPFLRSLVFQLRGIVERDSPGWGMANRLQSAAPETMQTMQRLARTLTSLDMDDHTQQAVVGASAFLAGALTMSSFSQPCSFQVAPDDDEDDAEARSFWSPMEKAPIAKAPMEKVIEGSGSSLTKIDGPSVGGVLKRGDAWEELDPILTE